MKVASILLIEPDSRIASDVRQSILKEDSASHILNEFTDVKSAISYLEDNSADIIITDIFAPEAECTRIIDLCSAKYPAARIILTSESREFVYARMAVRCANVVDFVTKPLDLDYLARITERLARTSDSKSAADRLSSKKREMFSNIVHGYTTNIDEIKRSFEYLELDISTTDQPCTLVHFHIKDFIAHVHSPQRQSPEQFYDAISGIVPLETEDAYFTLANYSYGNFSWFVVHRKRDSLPDRVNSIISMFKTSFEDKLNLITEVSSYKTWFSISDMLAGLDGDRMGDEQEADSTIDRALHYMRHNYHKDISLSTVAEYVNMSPIYFSSYFKKHTGEGFVNALTTIRIEQVAKLLVTTNMTIKDIKMAVGYGHTGNFYKHFQDRYNMTPNEYKRWYFGR